MLLLPFLPITALILQNATTLSNLLHYQVSQSLNDVISCFTFSIKREVERIGAKVYAATLLEKFITNMQRERSEVKIFFGNIRNIFTGFIFSKGLTSFLTGCILHLHQWQADSWSQPYWKVWRQKNISSLWMHFLLGSLSQTMLWRICHGLRWMFMMPPWCLSPRHSLLTFNNFLSDSSDNKKLPLYFYWLLKMWDLVFWFLIHGAFAINL